MLCTLLACCNLRRFRVQESFICVSFPRGIFRCESPPKRLRGHFTAGYRKWHGLWELILPFHHVFHMRNPCRNDVVFTKDRGEERQCRAQFMILFGEAFAAIAKEKRGRTASFVVRMQPDRLAGKARAWSCSVEVRNVQVPKDGEQMTAESRCRASN